MGDVMHYVLIIAIATILPTLAMCIMFVLVPWCTIDTCSMYTCVMLISIFRCSNYRLLISRRYDARCISRLSDTKLKHDDNGLYFTGRDANYIPYCTDGYMYMHVHVHVYTSMHARLAARDIVHNHLLMLWKESNACTHMHMTCIIIIY